MEPPQGARKEMPLPYMGLAVGSGSAPPIHGPGGLIRGLVGATLAVALGGGGVWLKFAPPCRYTGRLFVSGVQGRAP